MYLFYNGLEGLEKENGDVKYEGANEVGSLIGDTDTHANLKKVAGSDIRLSEGEAVSTGFYR